MVAELGTDLNQEPLGSIDATATMESWDLLMDFIAAQCNEHLEDSKRVYRMRLACEEILSNMMRETQSSVTVEGRVRIWVSSQIVTTNDNSWFEILLEDNGPFFDPKLDIPREIQSESPVEERPIGGLGLFLVQRSVDEACYQWLGSRNCYRLRMALHQPTLHQAHI